MIAAEDRLRRFIRRMEEEGGSEGSGGDENQLKGIVR
jgi:hypothetical protein